MTDLQNLFYITHYAILLPNLEISLFISLFYLFLFPSIVSCLSEAGAVYKLFFFAYVPTFLREYCVILLYSMLFTQYGVYLLNV